MLENETEIREDTEKMVLANEHMVIAAVYRPPSVVIFCDEMGKYCEGRVKNKVIRREDIIIGDFNIDFNENNNSKKKRLENTMSMYGFKNIISENTRITYISETKIDLCFVNNLDFDSGIIYETISDHLIIHVDIENKMERDKLKTGISRYGVYKNYGESNLKEI